MAKVGSGEQIFHAGEQENGEEKKSGATSLVDQQPGRRSLTRMTEWMSRFCSVASWHHAESTTVISWNVSVRPKWLAGSGRTGACVGVLSPNVHVPSEGKVLRT